MKIKTVFIILLLLLTVSFLTDSVLAVECGGNTFGDCPSFCSNGTARMRSTCKATTVHTRDEDITTYDCKDFGPFNCPADKPECKECTVTSTPDFVRSYCVVSGGTCDNVSDTCNDNGVCDNGETLANCPLDCANCTDTSIRKNDNTCQINSQCAWCPTPDSISFPYTFPAGVVTETNHACVNKTNDPLNCGGCGFTAERTATTTNPAGLCQPNTPFCTNGKCVGRATSPTCLATNPKFYYTVSGTENTGLYSTWCGADSNSSNPAYSLSTIDNDQTVCTGFAGGNDFSDTLGCCGDNKCRALSAGGGKLCNVKTICDGKNWQNGSDASLQGEVFKLTNCNTIYPIANINGAFDKCVDDDRFKNYSWVLNTIQCSGSASGDLCVPNIIKDYYSSDSRFKTICTTENKGIDYIYTGGLEYMCGTDKWSFGGSRVITSDGICRTHALFDKAYASDGSGELVCAAIDAGGSDMYGFLTIIPTASTNLKWREEGTHLYEECPGSPTQWIGINGNTYTPSVIMTCPGIIPFSGGDTGARTIVLYGGTSKRYALFCRALQSDELPPVEGDGLASLDYFQGNGTIMGTVTGHQYACTTNLNKTYDATQSRAYVAVCCGADNCTGINKEKIAIGAGVPYNTGDSIKMNNTAQLFCLPDGTWSNDLDYNYTQAACSKNSFSATGNYCCSEWDDTSTWINESYNDPGSKTGGCFKGTPQLNNNFFMKYQGTEYDNVLISNGSFYGCGFNLKSSFTPEYESGNKTCALTNGILSQSCLEKIENWPDPGANFNSTSTFRTKQPLINRMDYCALVNTTSNFGKSFYCSYTNNWTDSGGSNLSHQSIVPRDLMDYFKNQTGSNTLINASCCLPDECWDPTAGECIPEQSSSSAFYAINETTVYKCLQGNWTNVLGGGKKTPDGCFIGVCPGPFQCLYNIAGNAADNGNLSGDPQCLNNAQFIGDYLCNNGNWTTRTKMLAEKMASIAGSSDFVLMCGPVSDIIINTKQNLGDVNNYCILNHGSQRIIGTTLNQPLYNITHVDFITALGQSFYLSYPNSGVDFKPYCDALTTGFHQCVDNDYLKFYYDATYKMAIFSDQSVSLNPSLGDQICSILPSWLQWLCPKPSVIETNMANLKLFNKIYSTQQGDKQIFGVAEQTCSPINLKRGTLYTFNYTGFTNADLSYLVNNVVADNATITQSQNSIIINNPGKDAWKALTLIRNPDQQ